MVGGTTLIKIYISYVNCLSLIKELELELLSCFAKLIWKEDFWTEI